ncbi:hypothetical protein C0J52_27877 [Blattella germanica]|nr:hypothetical protein C0J52_27877 [Blattella germanica]
MRGLLGSIPYVSYSLGILIVYALGATLHWQTVAWLATILPIMSLISFLLLPESPVWLVRNDRVEEASKALNWLRGGESGGKQVCTVFEKKKKELWTGPKFTARSRINR